MLFCSLKQPPIHSLHHKFCRYCTGCKGCLFLSAVLRIMVVWIILVLSPRVAEISTLPPRSKPIHSFRKLWLFSYTVLRLMPSSVGSTKTELSVDRLELEISTHVRNHKFLDREVLMPYDMELSGPRDPRYLEFRSRAVYYSSQAFPRLILRCGQLPKRRRLQVKIMRFEVLLPVECHSADNYEVTMARKCTLTHDFESTLHTHTTWRELTGYGCFRLLLWERNTPVWKLSLSKVVHNVSPLLTVTHVDWMESREHIYPYIKHYHQCFDPGKKTSVPTH